jgi:cysteine desulfurase
MSASDNSTNRPRVPIYLDYQATTPVDPRVLQAMLPYFAEKFGNPGSVSHSFGREASLAVENAREQVAALIGADAREIVFTSGATESNNLAIKGAARFRGEERRHIVTLATEHKCVIESAKAMEAEGFRVTYLPVGPTGRVDLERLAAAIDEDTFLVSIMAAHNEIGTLQSLAEIGALCRAHGVYFHTDAAQAVGKIALDVEAFAIDLMSISGHKIYGPKGIGALYVRRRPRARLEPLLSGGGQERGLRSGTLPAPLIIGFGEACAISGQEMEEEAQRLTGLRKRFADGLAERVPDFRINGDVEHRLPGNLNVTLPGVDAEALMAAVPDLALSSGSACTSAEVEPSYVLRAIGLPEDLARASLRIGFGRFTEASEVDYAAQAIADAALRLRHEGRAPGIEAGSGAKAAG